MPDVPQSPLTARFATRIHRLTIALLNANPRTIDLLAPVNPDALLDDPVVRKRYHADDYMPYWPIIWPSGLMLAARILQEKASPPELPLQAPAAATPPRAIELGCGLGTTGIAAALRGWHVTFTDYDENAVEFAAHNAHLNGIPTDRVRPLTMDWRAPIAETFPWVLASDVLYERRLHAILLDAIEKVLAPKGQAWVSDPQRTAAEDFPLAAVTRGFKVQSINMEGESFGNARQTGQLYILSR